MKWWNNVLWKRRGYFYCLLNRSCSSLQEDRNRVWLAPQMLLLSPLWVRWKQKSRGRLAGSCSCCRKVNCVYYSCWKRCSLLVAQRARWSDGLVIQCLQSSRCVASKHFSCIPSVKIFFFVCYLTGFNCSPSLFDNVPVCKSYLGLCAAQSEHSGFCYSGFLDCPVMS